MSIETMKQTINTIQSVDGMKAVKVAFDLSQKNMDSITKITEVVSLIDSNLKDLATKVLKLEKKIEGLGGLCKQRSLKSLMTGLVRFVSKRQSRTGGVLMVIAVKIADRCWRRTNIQDQPRYNLG